ncbi:MAG: hypothetical protein JWM25_850, partial [Thermoleophilia bacterium]|nr:hypothetical protein [Thermoleophilia bacterium]
HTLRLGTRVIGTKASSLTKIGIAKPIIKLSSGGKAYVNSQFISTRASRLTMTITSSYKDTAGNGLVITARAVVTR